MNEEGGESHWTDSARMILNGISGERPLAPMGERQAAAFRRLTGQGDDGASLLRLDPCRCPGALGIAQALPRLGRGVRAGAPALAPLAHRFAPDIKARGDLSNLQALGRKKDDARPQRDLLRGPVRAN